MIDWKRLGIFLPITAIYFAVSWFLPVQTERLTHTHNPPAAMLFIAGLTLAYAWIFIQDIAERFFNTHEG